MSPATIGDSIEEGYYVGGHFGQMQRPFAFHGQVGRALRPPVSNDMSFTTGLGTRANPSVLSHALYRSLTLAIIECWEPTICYAQPSTLILRHLVQPADVPIIETTPDGGFLL